MSEVREWFASIDPRWVGTLVLLGLVLGAGLYFPHIRVALRNYLNQARGGGSREAKLAAGGLSLLLAVQAFSGETQHFFAGQPHWWLWVAAIGAAFLATYFLHGVVTRGGTWRWDDQVPAALLFLILAGASGVVVDLIHGCLVTGPQPATSGSEALIGASAWPRLAIAGMVAAFILAVPLAQEVIDRSDQRQWKPKGGSPLSLNEQCSCLIMGLSPMGAADAGCLRDRLPCALRPVWDRPLGLDAFLTAYDDSLNEEEQRACRWIMNLKGVGWHAGTARTVILVCTEETVGQAHHASELLRRFHSLVACFVLAHGDAHSANDCGLISVSAGPVPANDLFHASWTVQEYATLYDALERLLVCLSAGKYGYGEKDIMIDITSGLRPLAVVAATLTLNRRVRIQYVNANTASDQELSIYDLHRTSAHTH